MTIPRRITTEQICTIISMDLIINITEAIKNALQITRDILVDGHMSSKELLPQQNRKGLSER
jgi:hypothetical protein